jgi:6-phosphogluconolactonase
MALTGAGPLQLPAAAAHGIERTVWLLDRAAAREVSPSVRSLR